jgi:hypothetical protein
LSPSNVEWLMHIQSPHLFVLARDVPSGKDLCMLHENILVEAANDIYHFFKTGGCKIFETFIWQAKKVELLEFVDVVHVHVVELIKRIIMGIVLHQVRDSSSSSWSRDGSILKNMMVMTIIMMMIFVILMMLDWKKTRVTHYNIPVVLLTHWNASWSNFSTWRWVICMKGLSSFSRKSGCSVCDIRSDTNGGGDTSGGTIFSTVLARISAVFEKQSGKMM